MKNRLVSLTLLFLWGIPFISLGQDSRKLSNEQTEAQLWSYLQTYSPASYFMMQDFVQLPSRFEFGNSIMSLSKSDDILFWINDPTPAGIREDIGTTIHETNHSYTDVKAFQLVAEQLGEDYVFGTTYSAFYINPEKIILVEHLDAINSHKIARTIPSELRTFRYTPYLSPPAPLLGSQKDGIYGLMDEWCSYLNGTRTHVDLYEYYVAHPAANGSHALEWIQEIAGTHFAYLEFKYFILKYLQYVRENEPELYRQYLNQDQLWEAFFSIDRAFRAVVLEFYEKKAMLEQDLSAKGLSIQDTGEYFMVGGNGVGTYEQDYRKLEAELAKGEFQRLLQELHQHYQAR